MNKIIFNKSKHYKYNYIEQPSIMSLYYIGDFIYIVITNYISISYTYLFLLSITEISSNFYINIIYFKTNN